MSNVINDKQFAALFNESISSNYAGALLFMNTDPDISLMKLRKVLEALCLLYANHYNYNFQGTDLSEQIDVLAKEKFISGVNKKAFHSVRKLTNKGVHIESNVTCNNDEVDLPAVRVGVLELLEFAFIDLNIGKKLPKYNLMVAGGQEFKNLWYKSITSPFFQEHCDLGKLYEKIAEEDEKLMLIDSCYIARLPSGFKFAIEYYESAIKKSSGNHIDFILRNKHRKITINPKSFDCLFCYALLCLKGKVKNKSSIDAQVIFQALLKRGYKNVHAYLGWSCYLNRNYTQAKKYLTHKKVNKNAFAMNKLGLLFLEGKACKVEMKNTLNYFNKAVDLGCDESMLKLGELYHQGAYVKKNDTLAKKYLLQSIEQGNVDAVIYLGKYYLEEALLKLKTSLEMLNT